MVIRITLFEISIESVIEFGRIWIGEGPLSIDVSMKYDLLPSGGTWVAKKMSSCVAVLFLSGIDATKLAIGISWDGKSRPLNNNIGGNKLSALVNIYYTVWINNSNVIL